MFKKYLENLSDERLIEQLKDLRTMYNISSDRENGVKSLNRILEKIVLTERECEKRGLYYDEKEI